MKNDSLDIKGIAYHESGHLVVGYHQGLEPTKVTIKPDEKRVGYVTWKTEGSLHERAPELVRKDILTDMAGPLAYEKYTGNIAFSEKDPYAGMSGESAADGSDAFHLHDRILHLASPEPLEGESVEAWSARQEVAADAEFERLDREGRRLVDEYWSDIQRAAEKLLEIETLEGEDLSQFLRGMD